MLPSISKCIVLAVDATYVGCGVQSWAGSTDVVGSRSSVGVSLVAVCWHLDTTLLATGNTVLSSRVGVRSNVWSSALVNRVERAVGLALDFGVACEQPGVDTRLASDPAVAHGT